MQTLLDGHPKHSMAEGLFAENIVRISLQSSLEDTGFSAILAPQTLERSSKHHQGVDLVIADPTNTLWLGIDAKLREGARHMSEMGTDGIQKFLRHIFIFLWETGMGHFEK